MVQSKFFLLLPTALVGSSYAFRPSFVRLQRSRSRQHCFTPQRWPCFTTTSGSRSYGFYQRGRQGTSREQRDYTLDRSSLHEAHTKRFMLFQNEKDDLISSSRTIDEIEMTNDALSIVHQAIHAVNPGEAIRRHMRLENSSNKLHIVPVSATTSTSSSSTEENSYHANDYDNIILVAFGKASSAMAAACVTQLQQNEVWSKLPLQGLVICKDDHCTDEEASILQQANITIQEASHPVPDERSVKGAREIMKLVQSQQITTARTLVLCCISGGGSSLFCEPQHPLTLDDLQCTNSILLQSGLSIQNMNIIRKRLETGKGGKLAATAYPATLVTLVLSDILGDPLDLIASGPTVQDTSTSRDAWQLVQQSPTLMEQLPSSVLQMLETKAKQEGNDTMPSHLFDKTKTVLVGNNELAVMAAAEEASRLGYHPIVLGTRFEGEAQAMALTLVAMAQHISISSSRTDKDDTTSAHTHHNYNMVQRPAALIAGGETTVTLPSDHTGKGGRNQELALMAALKLQEWQLRNVVLASVGTDGTDGPTDAAGAVVDGGTILRMPGSAREAIQHHDAYPYLQQYELQQNHEERQDGNDGDDNMDGRRHHSPLIKTGPTGTNVADVIVTLIR